MSGGDERELVIGISPGGRPDGRLVVGVCRAGGFGVLDVGTNLDTAWRELELVEQRYGGAYGIRLTASIVVEPAAALPVRATTVIVAGIQQVAGFQATGRRVLVEVTTIDEAESAIAAGADGLIAKGAESGGRIGEETAYVLLQRITRHSDRPVWVQGGIGLHTAAAAIAGGAAGVVVDSQLALARDCTLPGPVRSAIAVMDGSETVVVGGHRVYTRPDLPTLDPATPSDVVHDRLGAEDLHTQVLPVGQDAAFASGLAERYKTAGGIVQALRRSIDVHLASAHESQPLSPGAGIAARHGLRYPIAQGPMTRVSDRAAFASVVADAGGLPFLALSLMRGEEITDLLDATRRQVGGQPWGVGILGFVPPELREEQLAAVREARPPVALVAGGRPSQAAPLEAEGIATFLHVPSPGLLDRFLRDGARRFVFEGRECGGHVGPRSSFTLWEQQVERLLAEDDLDEVEIFFAGGVHDARSAAMVATLAAPLAERGASIGVLMGTAYVATSEAVATGAITPTFQQVVLECRDTVLLETSPGHATRCVDSDYVAAFAQRRDQLVATQVASRDMWAELETLNLGRLRTAAKGIVREGDELVAVDASTQRREGMFMIGQVAALRSRPTSVAQLHVDVSEGSSRLLAESLRDQPRRGSARPLVTKPRRLDIAVIGAAGLFPGAGSVEEFWANVVGGVDSIREVPAERWSADRYYEPDPTRAAAEGKTPSRWGGFLDPVPFDPMRFGIPPTSVRSIGPDQLLSLEVAAAALAHAGYEDREFDRERTAVVFGAESGTDLAAAYAFRAALPHFVGEVPAELADKLPSLTEDSFPGVLANVIAGRIANRLDLGGANYTVDAACGASMAALSTACKELTTGAADMVLCGGADLHNGIYDYLLFAGVHALSPTGHCRTFDAAADGIALGEGIGCVVLKRLADAERDGDQILAVLDAVAASSDGRSLGLTAPRREGQRRALERAYDDAGVSPATVGLVEAHGTGTVVGDRTELTTLTDVYTERGAVPGSTALGSVKSQIGHTKCAAGMAGLIKAVHAVHRGVLPPTLNVSEPNAAYDPKTSPFVFLDRARPWVAEERRAGVSAFGFGGSNFHAVVSAYHAGDDPEHGLDHWPAELFVLRGDDALDHLDGLIDANDAAGRPWPLRDLAGTVAKRKSGQSVAWAFVADDLDDLRTKVAGLRAARGETDKADVFVAAGAWGDAGGDDPRLLGDVAFLFPGQGSQRVHMAADLFVAFPALRRFLDLGGPELVEQMFPPAFGAEGGDRPPLTDTRLAQPALGVVELAMTELLGRCGVRPDVTAGHSYGEIPALAVAGVLDDAAVVELSRARAHAILGALPADDPGTMAAVRGPVDEVRALLEEMAGPVVVANDNTPDQCVISGRTADVEAAARVLSERGHAVRRLAVGCAFHSPDLAAASHALRDHLADLPVASPQLPVWSNTTAAPYPADADAVRDMLAAQVSSPVAFRQQVEAMYEAGARTFVEVGPGRVLSQLVRRILGDRSHRMVACDVAGEPGIRRFLLALAELAAAGVPVDTSPLFAGRTAVVDAPTAVRPAPLLLDGQLIRDSDGEVVAGTLPPATEFPPLRLTPRLNGNGNGNGTGHGNGNGSGPGAQETVAEYLRGLQQIVAAERDVVLALLGSPTVGGAVQAASAAPPTVEQNWAPPARDDAPSTSKTEAFPLDHAGWLAVVVEVVSERTGYPAEMLDPDLDLEAELSIDSIKRIEILAELADRVTLPGMDDLDADEQLIEELAGVKTLRGIVDLILEQSNPSPSRNLGAGSLDRYVPELVTLPEPTSERSLAEVVVGVVKGRSNVIGPLCDALRSADAVPVGVEPNESGFAGVRLLVDLTPLRPNEDDDATTAVTSLFVRLRAAAMAGVPEVVVVTGLGGAFGVGGTVDGDDVTTNCSAATLGMVRTMAREFTDVRFRVVDLPAAGDPEQRASQVAAELASPGGPAEVGYLGTSRQTVEIVARKSSDASDASDEHRNEFHLGAHSVVLVTGGARGIGARCALELARRFGCGFEIVGRTPLPIGDEAPDLAGADDERAIRQVLVARGEHSRPSEIEGEVRRLVAARELRRNLAALQGVAASVGYHTADVRDATALRGVVDDIRLRHGRLDGVVHAAGMLDDKRIADKTVDSFARVFDTKVHGVDALVDAVDDGGFAVLFGSISGVFGNPGQVDYAAANTVLDVSAQRRSGASRERRILSIDWGPWASLPDGTGGMVTPELARQYDKRGIGLVDPDAGAAALVAELRRGAPDPQVVLMVAGPHDG